MGQHDYTPRTARVSEVTTISYPIPTPGVTSNSVADPQIATALTTILTWANGGIDTANIKAVIPFGLLAARPAAGSVSGAFYYATDSGLLYWSNGSAWTTVSSPAGVGAWQALTASAGWTAFQPIFGRLEGVDVVRLKGALQNTSGSTKTTGAICTLPGSLSTAITAQPSAGTANGIAVPQSLQINLTTAYLQTGSSVPSLGIVGLDGITYTTT